MSYPITLTSPRYGDKEPLEIYRVCQMSLGHISNNSELHLSAHMGTHIDVPYHFFNDGKTLDGYPPGFWICNQPHVINFPAGPEKIITVDMVKDEFSNISDNCDILLLNTDFSLYRNDKEKETYIFHNPGIAPDVGHWLRINTNIKMIGFDFISLSSYANRDLGREAHKAFLAELYEGDDNLDPILIIEDMNFLQMHKCPDSVIVSPLRFDKADGAPPTVFALYE